MRFTIDMDEKLLEEGQKLMRKIKGIYVLFIFVKRDIFVKAGSLSKINFFPLAKI